jgi:hypothetical protein
MSYPGGRTHHTGLVMQEVSNTNSKSTEDPTVGV